MEPTSDKNQPTLKVIFVEDDPLLCQLLSDKLSQSKFNFMFSYKGDDAVETIRNYQPNVIMLDIMLPGKDGLTILKELKADEELKHIPAIMFTNKSDETDISEAQKLGATRYCIKANTSLDDVITMIEKAHKGELTWAVI